MLALPTGIVASTFGDIWREYVTLRLARERTALRTKFTRKSKDGNDPTQSAAGTATVEMDRIEKGGSTSSSGKKEQAWVSGSVESSHPLGNTGHDYTKGKFLSAEDVVGIVESIRKHQQSIEGLLILLEEKALLQAQQKLSPSPQ